MMMVRKRQYGFELQVGGCQFTAIGNAEAGKESLSVKLELGLEDLLELYEELRAVLTYEGALEER